MNKKLNFEQLIWTLALLMIGGLLGLFLSTIQYPEWANSLTMFFSPLFAASLGGYVAYLGIRKNQRIESEEKKLEDINKHIYQLKRCLIGMCTIKSSYFKTIGTGLYRTLKIRRSVNSVKKVNVDISNILFLIKGSKAGEPADIDLVLMDSALDNFNLALEMLDRRDQTQSEFLIAARQAGAIYAGDGSIEGDVDALIVALGQDNIDLLIHMGEKLIQLTDTAIDHLAESLDQLQSKAGTKIDINHIPDSLIAHYYVEKDSEQYVLIENPVPKGEWEKKPYYEKPLALYPKRERLKPRRE